MEAKALETLRDMSVASAKITLNTDKPAVLMPGSFQVVDLEKFDKHRSRFRGTYSTSSLKDFADHVVNRDAGATGFINADDADKLSCTVFYNIGDQAQPGHCDDIAVLTLKPTAAFKAVQGVVGKSMDQKTLSDWIQDWSLTLSATDVDGKDLELRKTIAAVRNIKIEAKASSDHSVGNMNAARSSMEQIEARSEHELPAYLIMSAIPFSGLQVRQLKLAVSVLTGGEKPALSLRWVGKEPQLEEINQEFKCVLSKEVGGSARLFLGSFDPR